MATGPGGVRVVGVAADAASGGDPTAPVQAALVAAGVPIDGRILVDDDESALERALAPAFRASLRDAVNPYGDGHAAARIVEVLRTVALDAALVRKRWAA